MADSDFLTAAGPLWGPDFVTVQANDETGTTYALQVYPDARNGQLKAAGLPEQYYFQPSQIYVSKLITSPQDFDFGMTVFKGLETSETTIGVKGEVEAGGGFCVFSTTFGIPDSVIANAIQKLKSHDHPAPADRLAQHFGYGAGDPDPLLGIIPISENNVSISVPNLVKASDGSTIPMFIDAQTTGKGSIEAHGISSFLVTCNQAAAGAIAGALTDGHPPFTIGANLKEQFYIEGCSITVVVDVDKVYDSVSVAVSAGGFLGISTATLNAAYSSLTTSGGITTQITMDAGVLTDDQKKWIMNNVDDMRKKAFDMVKQDIFDWDPSKTDTPATADRGWASSVFGGASVSLKATYERRNIQYTDSIRLTETIAVNNEVNGDLNDLMPAVVANLNKYLAVVDIGEYFQKIQVAGTAAINFDEKLPDGTEIKDPLVSVQLEAAYPDFDNSLDGSGQPNLVTLAQGQHYTLAQVTPSASLAPAVWTSDNPKDFVNLAWLRLPNDLANWPANQVHVRKTLVFDGTDPRVDLASGGVTFVSEYNATDHAPVLTAAEAGYVYVHFMLDRVLPKDNITVTLTCTLGSRQDTFTFTKANQKNVIWQVFSDKYLSLSCFTYSVQVEVDGPNFTDNPVIWQTDPANPVQVALPQGRIKYVNPLKITLPPVPDAEKATVNGYIAAYTGS